MDYAIFSILGLALVAFLVYMGWKYIKQNDYEKAMREHYDFEESDCYK